LNDGVPNDAILYDDTIETKMGVYNIVGTIELGSSMGTDQD
jgi:hypothetical protein